MGDLRTSFSSTRARDLSPSTRTSKPAKDKSNWLDPQCELKTISRKYLIGDSPQCHLCHDEFALTNKSKHNCRYCGAFVCKECSSWHLNNFRACTDCINRVHFSRRCGHCMCIVCANTQGYKFSWMTLALIALMFFPFRAL